MFAPHHQAAADELVRVCRPGGTIGLLSWTPEGMLGALFRTMRPFMPPPPPGAQPAAAVGQRGRTCDELFGDRVGFRTSRRDVLEITAFSHARDYAAHFKADYGPTIAARANAEREGRAAEFDEALDRFCDEWDRGTPDARAVREGVPHRRRHPRLAGWVTPRAPRRGRGASGSPASGTRWTGAPRPSSG